MTPIKVNEGPDDAPMPMLPKADQVAIPYNCDPVANHRAMALLNELIRRGRLKSTREQAIDSLRRGLDAAVRQGQGNKP